MKAWAYSGLKQYLTCPRQYQAQRVTKEIESRPTEETIWGEWVHKQLELAITEDKPLPDSLHNLLPVVDRIKRFGGDLLAEYKLGAKRDLSPCGFDDADAWTRGIIDVCAVNGHRAMLIDWKTGSVRPTGQLAQNALMVFAHYPEVTTIKCLFAWLKHNEVTQEIYKRDDMMVVLNKFIPTVNQMEKSYETDVWPCKPSGLCRGWCDVKTCMYWEPGRKQR